MSSGVIKSSNGHSKINKFMSWITMRFTLFASLNWIKTYNYYENGLLGSGANVHIGWSIGWAWIQTEMTSIHTNWSVVLTVEFEIVAEAAALNCRRKGVDNSGVFTSQQLSEAVQFGELASRGEKPCTPSRPHKCCWKIGYAIRSSWR